MNAELREKVARALADWEWPHCGGADPHTFNKDMPNWHFRLKHADALAPIIAEVEAAARADERERCAKVVMEFADCVTSGSIHPANKAGQDADYAMCEDIAAAIRAQKEPTP